ncbi:MAG: 3-oxoacyl-ACP reductase [Flavobacteriales bacterium]|nr:MAG: 3-oxoacyl-ACP reductase [Flavobacteriales bacterium]
MDFLELKNKNIIITGASSGIGRETAILLDDLGADLILTGRNLEKLEETKAQLKREPNIFQADLTIEEERTALIASLPKLEGVVNAAGIIYPFPLKFITEKHIKTVFDINFKAQALLNSALLKQKKIAEGCSFVFISSISSQFPYQGGALYTSAKAALEAYARTLALEHSAKKVRSNCISPGLVKTNIFEETLKASSAEELEKYEKNYPLGFGEPIDVANTIAFLLSNRSRWVTGQNIVLDGGLTLGSK